MREFQRVLFRWLVVPLVIGLIAGCGRLNFDPLDSGSAGDDASDGGDGSVVAGTCATRIATGYTFSCAIVGGEVFCWGSNFQGQLGDGTTDDHAVPQRVLGLTGIDQLALGDQHACARATTGALYCWGYGNDGQLGIGAAGGRTTPTQLTDLGTTVASVAAGWGHTCAVTTTGAVSCWGNNDFGQLGDSSTMRRTRPVTILIGGTAASVVGGQWHTCARRTDSSVVCWGLNGSGQLGVGDTVERHEAGPAVGGLAAQQVASGGFHSCAIAGGGAVCWGAGANGSLGDGLQTTSTTPVAVVGMGSGVAQIEAGDNASTCARTTSGALQCWGQNNNGKLGDGTSVTRSTPVAVIGMDAEVEELAVGGNHACARKSDGSVWCWGLNQAGELGDGTTMMRMEPVIAIAGC